ncbi:MAG: PhoH family protein [Verrucomicrobia bacterium]|nr:MAG: PhoH family protein [Verrucomicrobiota bacterium]
MKKTYVLDTNVLLHDPTAIHHFEDNDVVIPLKVIEEIDQFKRDMSELGRNARQISRMLDAMRQQGHLVKGVTLEGGGTLRIAFPRTDDPLHAAGSADDQILRMAMEVQRAAPQQPCLVVSKDINLRLKADALGLTAEDYETDRVDLSELYTGQGEKTMPGEALEAIRQGNKVAVDDPNLYPNQYLLLRDETDTNRTVLARHDGEAKALVPLIGVPEELRHVMPRNKEQYFAMDALLNDAVKVVTIIGKAGTGKTLLAVAAALYKVFNSKTYRKMLVSRPTFPMGKDIGFLPGTVEEKLNPWMQPIFDALDLLANGHGPIRRGKDGLDEGGRISIESLTYIRGRSIPHQFMIVDEAQNLTPLEAKTVLTRVGPGTKIVLTGDIYQIDNPYVDSMSNGLSTVAERFKSYGIAAHLLLTKGVRSDVAELAANLL